MSKQGTIVSDRTEPSRKLPGTAGRQVGSEVIHQEQGECTHVHLCMNNKTTAVFYVCEPQGRDLVPKMSRLAIQFWQWCLTELESRPKCDGNGRSAASIEQVDRICLLTFLSDQGMPQKGQGGQGISGAGGSSMEIPALVSSSARSSDRSLPDPSSRPRPSGGPLQQSAFTGSNRPVMFSCVETIW